MAPGAVGVVGGGDGDGDGAVDTVEEGAVGDDPHAAATNSAHKMAPRMVILR
jgi:hypothetical protein